MLNKILSESESESNMIIIVSDNGLSHVRRQANIWNKQGLFMLTGSIVAHFNDIISKI